MSRIGILLIMLLAAVCMPAQVPGQQALQIVNGPTVEAADSNSAVIAWSTNTGGSSVVRYGTDPSNLSQTAQTEYERGQGTHRVTIKNLQPNTTYYYQVVSAQGQGTGTMAQSQVGQFTTSAAGQNASKVPLYRAAGPQGSHLFTTDYQEYQKSQASGFKPEGIAAYIHNSQAPGDVPLYHLAGPNGDNFYTTNAAERDRAIQQRYTDRGIAGYVASTPQPGTEPLHRMVNPAAGEHFYTANSAEHSQLLTQGMKDEGVTGYVWSH
jgi:hypothetical protein